MSAVGRPSLGGRGGLARAGASKEVYSFPVLSTEALLVDLRKFGIVASEDDINKPRPETFRHISDQLLARVLGMEPRQLYEADPDFVDELGGYELHEESLPVIHFMRHMNKVLEAARCDDFLTIRDLVKLDRVRVVRMWSAVVNFIMFQQLKQTWYDDMESKKHALVEKKMEALAEQESIRQQIDEHRAIREAEMPAIMEVGAHCKELEAKRNATHAQIEELRALSAAQKDEVMELRARQSELQQRLAAVRAETEARRAQIVSSPAKIRAEIAALEAGVEAEQRGVDEVDASKRTVSRQLEVVAKAEKDVRKAMALMAEAEAEALKVKRQQKEERAKRGEADALAAEADALRDTAAHAAAARRRAEEKLAELKEGYAGKLAAQARALEAIRREAAEYADGAKADTERRRAAEARQMQLERAQEAMTARHTAEVQEILSHLKRLSASVAGYHTHLFGQLGLVESIPFAPVAAGAGNAAAGAGAGAGPLLHASSVGL